ncbi:MAG: hypothetical protein HONDAALG_02626 [Gammaproteobacteria bacterium]|nr:hypothetical protein [Gammaproteobacteria bacterium]
MKEHGAALVEVNGRLAVAAARSGSYIAFPLKDEEMRASGFLGYFHTHPYEDATMGVAFSPGDLRITISRKMKICVVQSGEDLFMVAQTPDTPEQIAVDEITESEFNDRVAFYQRLGQSWQEAVFQTNLHLCREYGFAFYAGKLCQPLERR